MDFEYFAMKRNMTVDEYIAWLKRQLDILDFDSDDIPGDVAEYAGSHHRHAGQRTRSRRRA